MKDAVIYYSKKIDSNILVDFSISKYKYILLTIHREENVDRIDHLKSIFDQLLLLAETTTIVFTASSTNFQSIKKNSLL